MSIDNFAHFFKRTQVLQIYVILVSSLIMYGFLWMEIPRFTDLNYEVQITLALAAGCIYGYISIASSYIYYHLLYGKIEEEHTSEKTITKIYTYPHCKKIEREKYLHISHTKRDVDSTSYLGLALFFTILSFFFLCLLWYSNTIKEFRIYLWRESSSYKYDLFSFYICYLIMAVMCLILTALTNGLGKATIVFIKRLYKKSTTFLITLYKPRRNKKEQGHKK